MSTRIPQSPPGKSNGDPVAELPDPPPAPPAFWPGLPPDAGRGDAEPDPPPGPTVHVGYRASELAPCTECGKLSRLAAVGDGGPCFSCTVKRQSEEPAPDPAIENARAESKAMGEMVEALAGLDPVKRSRVILAAVILYGIELPEGFEG